jgi:hypothetical protein
MGRHLSRPDVSNDADVLGGPDVLMALMSAMALTSRRYRCFEGTDVLGGPASNPMA